ncbi:MAG: hypothetical protein FWE21_05755 [Defluviitaleaceae bacterium]|nr:hypothetical protein [Defluviitaleaceae bacterium]
MYTTGMSEEQYKQVIYDIYFTNYMYKPNFGQSRIDFVLACNQQENRHLLWAEVKNEPEDPHTMLTQLLLTIKKTWNGGEVVPPAYLGVMDSTTLTFYAMADFSELLLRNDVDWRATPSNYKSQAFKHLRGLLPKYITVHRAFRLDHTEEMAELPKWITRRIGKQDNMEGVDINIGNLNHVFNKWCDVVKPQINLTAEKWKEYLTRNIYASDFFLAGLYVDADKQETLVQQLKVIFRGDRYYVKDDGVQLVLDDETFRWVTFKDGGAAYTDFWKMYKRPPRRKHAYEGEKTPWDEILERRDVLVPRDIMERKGAFFTPRIWVEKAHQYLADALGDNWQDEYIIYDCAAGSGNLLAGLHNKRNIYASTIDEADVRIMMSETKPTYIGNIFQFDFLNDPFIRQSCCAFCKDMDGNPARLKSGTCPMCNRKDGAGKVPDALMDILECPEKRKKVVFLINPPYAESMNRGELNKGDTDEVLAKTGVNDSVTEEKYSGKLGKAVREVFAQFVARIYGEMEGAILAEFSKLKILQAPNFDQMRGWFTPKLIGCFVVPGNSFDNVKGSFPIGFKIWDTSTSEPFSEFSADAYDANGTYLKQHLILNSDASKINAWLKKYLVSEGEEIGGMCCTGNDFQKQGTVHFASNVASVKAGNAKGIAKFKIAPENLKASVVYYSVRWSEDATWLNDRDQFLYPHTEPLQDADFINDCLIFSIFHGNNHISIKKGENHWIPFTEEQVGQTRQPFTHNTIQQYLHNRGLPANLSPEAQAVYNTALEIFKYYHMGQTGAQAGWGQAPTLPAGRHQCGGDFTYNPNAALYDIRQHFQGTKPNGHMKVKSDDPTYQALIADLREKLRTLRNTRITPKVYKYGFLL